MYDKDVKYVNWSDLSAEEKDEIYFRNKIAVRHLEILCNQQGYLTYGDIYETVGLWDQDAKTDPLRKQYYDWPYILKKD